MSDIQRVNVWYDKAGNFLEVIWSPQVSNCYMPTADEKVDVLLDRRAGSFSGFMVWGVSHIKDGEIVNADLTPADLPQAAPEPAATV